MDWHRARRAGYRQQQLNEHENFKTVEMYSIRSVQPVVAVFCLHVYMCLSIYSLNLCLKNNIVCIILLILYLSLNVIALSASDMHRTYNAEMKTNLEPNRSRFNCMDSVHFRFGYDTPHTRTIGQYQSCLCFVFFSFFLFGSVSFLEYSATFETEGRWFSTQNLNVFIQPKLARIRFETPSLYSTMCVMTIQPNAKTFSFSFWFLL